MAKSIYISTTESQSGKSVISLGMVDLAMRKTSKVGVFRPIIRGSGQQDERDEHLDLLLSRIGDRLEYNDCYAFTREEANKLLGQGRMDDFIESVIEHYKKIEKQCDIIIIEGTDFQGDNTAFEFDINAEVARNLGAPVILVEGAYNQSSEETINNLKIALASFEKNDCSVLSIIINRVDALKKSDLLHRVKQELPENLLIYAIPENKILASPSMQEIRDALKAEILYEGDGMSQLIYSYSAAAMQVPNFLNNMRDQLLVITPGDRVDILLASLQAHISTNYPGVAGILLTGGFRPEPSVRKILDGLDEIIPILAVETNTFDTAMAVSRVKSKINKDDERKLQLSLKVFDENVDTETLNERVLAFKSKGITPGMFIYSLQENAKADKKRIVLPEGEDTRILKATEYLLNHQSVDITLLGNYEEIDKQIKKLGLQFPKSGFEIIDPGKSEFYKDYTNTLVELRKHKGMNMDMAKDLINDVSYFGTMMVYKGHADGMVSGAVHTTQHTIRPALQIIKTKPGHNVVSSVFFMCLEDRVLVYGDCAINPNPNAEELAEIAIASAQTSAAFGIEPRVAILSYSSGTSGKGADVERVREATQIVKKSQPDLKVEGPIQYDAAVDPEVGIKKIPGSEVAGFATVLIFPDLNTGNNTYKAVQRETGAIAIGPVIQGLNKPVNDLSRGCTVQDIINTVMITAIQAQNSDKS
ncbi:MAG: phosphate acetyltransferase [Candidatus Cyclobacteriaceae bacterium M2_1C_046]